MTMSSEESEGDAEMVDPPAIADQAVVAVAKRKRLPAAAAPPKPSVKPVMDSATFEDFLKFAAKT